MKNNLISARRASLADAPSLVSLDERFTIEGSRDWAAVLEQENKAAEVWLAQDRGICVGYMVVRKTATVAFPSELSVRPYSDQETVREALTTTAAAILLEQGLDWVASEPEPFPRNLTQLLPA